MKRRVLMFLAALVVIGGCQSNEIKDTEGTSTQEVPSVPYSRGPTAPPYVKGPSGPPPSPSAYKPEPAVDSGDEQQSVSEVDTVRYELPENPEVKVKQ